MLRQLFCHSFRAEEVQVQVARPLLSEDGTPQLPRLEAVVLGRHAPTSGCCHCSVLTFFDVVCGVAVVCLRESCESPALQLEPLSEASRELIWGPFLALNCGVLPKHRLGKAFSERT